MFKYCLFAQVTSARNKLTVACHPDKACLPGNSFVVQLEGVGPLMGKPALEVWPTFQTHNHI